MQMLSARTELMYFHQASPDRIDICEANACAKLTICWWVLLWHRQQVASPFCGAVFASQALGGIEAITQIDDSAGPYAVYGLYDNSNCSQPSKALLYNSDLCGTYTTGVRSNHVFNLTDFGDATSVTVIRLQGQFVDHTHNDSIPSTSGLSFEDGSCKKVGQQAPESFSTSGGAVSIPVMASEAVLVYLKRDQS